MDEDPDCSASKAVTEKEARRDPSKRLQEDWPDIVAGGCQERQRRLR